GPREAREGEGAAAPELGATPSPSHRCAMGPFLSREGRGEQRAGALMFGPFVRMVAFRYLRARRAEGFISVIAIFSLLGIALGVATLIIVMSVMNGFRAELLGRILGLNGHLGVVSAQGPLPGYDALAQQIAGVPGIVRVVPLVEQQVMATAQGRS